MQPIDFIGSKKVSAADTLRGLKESSRLHQARLHQARLHKARLHKAGDPQDRAILFGQADDIMPHRGIIIGAVAPAQVDEFVEFSEQANDPGQHIEKHLAVMANPRSASAVTCFARMLQ